MNYILSPGCNFGEVARQAAVAVVDALCRQDSEEGRQWLSPRQYGRRGKAVGEACPNASGFCFIGKLGTSGSFVSLAAEIVNRGVNLDHTLLSGRAAIDPTLWRAHDRWWLSCTFRDDGPDSRLHLFHSAQVRGPWMPHRLNPVKDDFGSARPAGPTVLWRVILLSGRRKTVRLPMEAPWFSTRFEALIRTPTRKSRYVGSSRHFSVCVAARPAASLALMDSAAVPTELPV